MSWIKVRHCLPRAPEVVRMSQQLRKKPAHVVGMCVLFWLWADENTEDGRLSRHTIEPDIDDLVGQEGFAAALLDCRWLKLRRGRFVIPNYLRHMGDSAKSRALGAARQQRHRERYGSGARQDQNRPDQKGGEQTAASITRDLAKKALAEIGR